MIHKYPYTDFNEYNLDWIIERVKTLTEEWIDTRDEWTDTKEEWDELYTYVHDYFDNLDVSQEVGQIINDYRLDGTLSTICQPIVDHWVETNVPNQINEWLDTNITQETGYVLDRSLTLSNAAAPADLVGDLKQDLNLVENLLMTEVDAHSASMDFSYSNTLNNTYVWVVKEPIPADVLEVALNIYSTWSGFTGDVVVAFLTKNANDTYTAIGTASLTTVVGINNVTIPETVTFETDVYIGFYSLNAGMAWSGVGETEAMTRFSYSDIEMEEITLSGDFTMNFSYSLVYKIRKANEEHKGIVVVNPDGSADYTDVITAINSEPENTVIYITSGVYEQDMDDCLKKRIILIGADRDTCIIRDTDGRYGHHPLYISCGYFENLTIEAPYVRGVSHEIGVSDLGAYAVHIDTDGDYGIGKTTEFHHCTLKSDFFPAVGLGMRKNATFIFDDCILENNQIANRGDYSDEGTLGALYFHDSNGEQGDQYIVVKDCVLKSKLQYAMCPYQVTRSPQNNRVFCDFIRNVLYSDVGKYTDTVWFRGDPFNVSTGIFSIGIGYGNSINSINN